MVVCPRGSCHGNASGVCEGWCRESGWIFVLCLMQRWTVYEMLANGMLGYRVFLAIRLPSVVFVLQ